MSPSHGSEDIPIRKTLIIAFLTLFLTLQPITQVSQVNAPERNVERKTGILRLVLAKEEQKPDKSAEILSEITPEPIKSLTERDEIIQEVRNQAKLYNINVNLATDLAGFESQFNPNAKNKKSTAGGIYQFLDSSWDSFCSGDKFDARDNISCFMELVSDDRRNISHWSVDINVRKFLWKRKYIECTDIENNICWPAWK